MGQETEYAIRFSPEGRRPGNDALYDAIARAISAHVRTEPGMYAERPQIFTENGGAFHYEYLPYRAEGGLIEGATPECRGPAQLLLYQKAQESLLRRALPDAERTLKLSGFPGELGLLKNCRDAEGHVYGAQESFEVEVAGGASLLLYRVGLVSVLPLVLLTVLLGWAIVLALVVIALGGGLLAAMVLALPPFRRRRWLERFTSREDHTVENVLGRALYWLSYVVTGPVVTSMALIFRLFAFRRLRKQATAFLVSRPVLSGAGSVDPEGRFSLSEKGPAIRRLMRVSISPDDRAIFDTGNLMKPAFAAAYFHFTPLSRLFARRQRLQLGLADSNMLEETEFLKIGATALVIDMVEAGFLDDAPRLSKPVSALHAIASDPTLEHRVRTDGGEMTAIELQRFYLDRAKDYLMQSRATSMEASDVVRLWEEALSRLERKDFASLVGRLDWVTKRYLLEGCGSPSEPELLKTIDLRYHELDDGYAHRLEREGLARHVLEPRAIERAVHDPPEGTPAYTRGRFIRSESQHLSPVRIAWDSARIGGRLRGRILRFPGD